MADVPTPPSGYAFHPGAGPAFGVTNDDIRDLMGKMHNRQDADAIQQGIDERQQQPREGGTPAPDDSEMG